MPFRLTSARQHFRTVSPRAVFHPSVLDFIRLEPRIICDSYIAGIADLYVNGLLQVYLKFPSTENPEFYIRDDTENVIQNHQTTTADTSDSSSDGL